MSRDELEQNIIELTTQVEFQKQKFQWLQEQFDFLTKRNGLRMRQKNRFRSLIWQRWLLQRKRKQKAGSCAW